MQTIDETRRKKLTLLIHECGSQAALSKKIDKSAAQISQWLNASPDSKSGKPRVISSEMAREIEEKMEKQLGWMDQPDTDDSAMQFAKTSQDVGSDLVIQQFDTGGSMGHGSLLTETAPGMIKSWRVDPDWLRLNVPAHTGLKNLAIVTGFGPSMRPMFNPGDPLLVDRGVTKIDQEAVYFFRVGEEGFIKLVQRVPEPNGPGIILRIISKNPDYPPYDINPKNPYFEVLAKVLIVWRSETY